MKNIQYMEVNTFHPYLNSIYADIFSMLEDNDYPIIPIVVDSPGGYVWCLSTLLDMIQDSKKPVCTIASGIAMSCGAGLFVAGTPGLRIVGPNTSILLHQVSSMTYGKSADIESDAKDISASTDKFLYDLFDKQSGQESGFTKNLIKENFNADLYVSPEQAVSYGFADKIMSRTKALKNLDLIYEEYLKGRGGNNDFSKTI